MLFHDDKPTPGANDGLNEPYFADDWHGEKDGYLELPHRIYRNPNEPAPDTPERGHSTPKS